MLPASATQKQIKKRMKSINVSHRSYFIKGDTNIRLCHLENGNYNYHVFPFCDCERLAIAAQILKQCGIIDNYKVEETEDASYVVLLRFKYRKHVDSRGVVWNVLEPKPVEWNDLRLTRTDAKEFIARFEIFSTEVPTPRRTPCVPMVTPATDQVIKFEPYQFSKAA
jgi:hypothetical protein